MRDSHGEFQYGDVVNTACIVWLEFHERSDALATSPEASSHDEVLRRLRRRLNLDTDRTLRGAHHFDQRLANGKGAFRCP